MSERSMRTCGDVSSDYWTAVYDSPLEYWPDANEVPEPSRLFESSRNPRLTPDLAGLDAQQAPQADETVEIDMTVGMGEDPGRYHARPAKRWSGPSRTTARQET
jgi:hypothetical protein